MKKYVVLSVNWNPDYLYYVPLTVWAWRKLGWEPIVFIEGSERKDLIEYVKFKANIDIDLGLFTPELTIPEGYRSDTVTQVSRLYGACLMHGPEDVYLMTSDCDMFPLSDYWKPDLSKDIITVWGHDLTGYTHYPICYIGMLASKWRQVMGLTSNDYNALIKRDLDQMPDAKNPDFYKYWFTDQELITKRINETTFEKQFIHRGQYLSGFAYGRVDRGDWQYNHEQYIDCHALRNLYKKTDTSARDLSRTMRILDRCFPGENISWILDYTKEFRKLANNG